MSRLLTLIMAAILLAACGAPPKALPTGPPPAPQSAGAPSGSGAPPSGGLPSGGLPSLPSGTVTPFYPGGTLPPAIPTVPTIPTTPTTPGTTPSTSPPPPSPAPGCGGTPSRPKMVDLVKGKPGIPAEQLEVRSGPYCASGWQFAILGIVGKDDDSAEPLLVVSKGRPTSPRLVAAGADVCTDTVEDDAPPGIRVRACGS